MGFDASSISGLDFTFKPYLDVDGVTPDPSEEMVRAFNLAIDRLAKKAEQERKAIVGDADEITDEMLTSLDELSAAVHEETLDALAVLCGGCPTREQIAELPYRVQKAFLASLQEEIENPTSRPAMKPPLAAVR